MEEEQSTGPTLEPTKKFQVNLDDYELGDKIGEGAFGSVFRCKKKDTGEILAAKQMLISKNDKQSRAYFNREIGVMTRVNHPTIIKFYGYSIEENEEDNQLLLTIIMELSNKGCLESVLTQIRNKNTVPDYDNTTRQMLLIGIARAMMYLHKRRIIFRDLKTLNILLDDDFHPLISDFGLAKIITEDDLLNTQKVGTLLTMAPEVMTGQKYNGKADVYSFGIVMYQIITDTKPFADLCKANPRMGAVKFIKFVAEDGRRPTFDKPIKKSLQDLIEKCWSQNEDERPTFDELFYKLAYNHSDSIYDDLFDNNSDNNYYLDDVDEDAILAYADSIANDNTNDALTASIDDLRRQISKIKSENEKAFKVLTDENKRMRKENERLAKEKKEIEGRLKALEKEFGDLKQSKPKDASKKPYKKSDPKPASGDDDDADDNNDGVKICNYKKGSEFRGILSHLTEKTMGNIADNGTISITSENSHTPDKSDDDNQFQPRNIVDYDDMSSSFLSDDKPGAFILFDFKKRSVQLTGYTLRSNTKKGSTANLKKWNVDVSNDNKHWTNIDEQSDCGALKSENRVASFKVQKKLDGFYRYVRIIQTGHSFYKLNNHNMFAISKVEFFGKVKE